ncbi:MAG: tRNA (N6-threonylcarbamoyladenosine(37)-N6)-methyltransferase TrmO [Polyangiaceae bacterium]
MTEDDGEERFVFRPIGHVESPYVERVDAPRQAVVSEVEGRIRLDPSLEDALDGLEAWSHLWVVFVFHHNPSWRPKVLPPRSDKRRGVLATRSPHRPNPIGLSVVRLLRVEGATLHVRELDMLDGTPVLDIKPYVPYADALVEANDGWLRQPDPGPSWHVTLAPLADEQLTFLADLDVDLRPSLEAALRLGPKPHAYRRIRRRGDRHELALKEWRVIFIPRESDEAILVEAIASGYRPRQIAEAETKGLLAAHRAFTDRWGHAPR